MKKLQVCKCGHSEKYTSWSFSHLQLKGHFALFGEITEMIVDMDDVEAEILLRKNKTTSKTTLKLISKLTAGYGVHFSFNLKLSYLFLKVCSDII